MIWNEVRDRMDLINTSNIITIAGWIAGPLIGTIIAIVSRRRTERLERVLAWAVVTEAEVIKKEVGQSLPVKISVGGKEEDSLSTIRVQIGSSGYKPLEALDVVVRFGEQSRVVHSKILPGPSKEFQKKLAINSRVDGGEELCVVTLPFLNLGQSVVLEFMVAAYRAGCVAVDCAEKGVEVKKTSAVRFEAALLPPGKPIALIWQAFGFSYDETPETLRQIAEELRELRRAFDARSRGAQAAQSLTKPSTEATPSGDNQGKEPVLAAQQPAAPDGAASLAPLGTAPHG